MALRRGARGAIAAEPQRRGNCTQRPVLAPVVHATALQEQGARPRCPSSPQTGRAAPGRAARPHPEHVLQAGWPYMHVSEVTHVGSTAGALHKVCAMAFVACAHGCASSVAQQVHACLRVTTTIHCTGADISRLRAGCGQWHAAGGAVFSASTGESTTPAGRLPRPAAGMAALRYPLCQEFQPLSTPATAAFSDQRPATQPAAYSHMALLRTPSSRQAGGYQQ